MHRALRRAVATALAVCGPAASVSAEPRFESYEIRVIRPRYMVKAGRVELAGGLGAIVNQTFVYSLVASGLLAWHLSETWALEAQGGYAASFDRQDAETLDRRFAIKTVVQRPKSLANGRVVWTPSYGKFHLTKARIVYFDTHVTLGAGVTGVEQGYAHCEGRGPAPKVFSYQTLVAGIGQRYFIDKSSSLRLGLELQRYRSDAVDAACDPETATSAPVYNDNLLLLFAWSHYL